MKTSIPFTLWRYLAKRYAIQIAVVGVSLLGLIYVFEALELIRRADGQVATVDLLGMALLKLPETAQILFPFIFLIAGLSLFWQLERASELVVMRAVGISAWQFVAPIALAAFLLGVLNISLIQPLSAASLTRYNVLEAGYFGKPRRIAALNAQGLWLRDASENGTIRLMHARVIDGDEQGLQDIFVLNLDDKGRLVSRLDAPQGLYNDDNWVLQNGLQTLADGRIASFTQQMVKINVSRSDIFSGFGDAATFSSWTLPEHIKILAASGFPTRSLILYYQNLLATPFLWMAMALIAVVVSLTPHRFGKTALMIGIGIGAGFFYFLFARYFEALSLIQRIPEFMAAWVPVILATIIPVTTLLKKEDG